jgi:DNA-directed RNA polymerase subunit RPC12/RpoP
MVLGDYMSYYCDNCDKPYDTLHGMAMHYLNSGSHPNVSEYPAAESLADDSKQDTSDTSNSNSSKPNSSELDFPENPDASDPDPEPETEPSRSRCPDCGSGNFASSDLALQKVPNLSERAKKALKAHDYHCHDCGEVFDL